MVLGFQWEWIVPAATNRLSPAVQCDRRLAVLLPNTGAGQNVEGDRCRMQMARIHRAWRVPRVPDNDLLTGRIGQLAFEQKRVGNLRLLLRRNGLRKKHAEARKRREVD